MPRSRYNSRYGNRSRSYRLRGVPRRGPMAWFRLPHTQADLSAATNRAELVVVSGAGLSPTPAVELAMNRRRSAFIERIIIRLAVVVINNLTAAVIKYWFGVRKQEATDAGGNIAIVDAPALNTADTGDRRENWLYRKSLNCTAPGSGAAITPFLDYGGSPQIMVDWKPKRPLEVRELLVFQHQWVLAAGGFPDANLQAFVEMDILLRLAQT